MALLSALAGRGNIAQPSGNLYGREDTEYLNGILALNNFRNPAITVLANAGVARSDTKDVHWFDSNPRPYRDQLNFSTGYNSSATGLVVDNAVYFSVGDNVKHDDTGEMMLVTSVGSTYIGVIRDLGQSTEGFTALAGTVDDNDFLTIVSSSFEAGHPLPTIKHMQETEFINYHYDHRTPYGLTEALADTALRSARNEVVRKKNEASQFHLEGIDKAFFDGKPYRGDKGTFNTTDGNADPMTAFGLNHYLETYTRSANKVDQTELTLFEIYDWLEAVFDKGSDEKICFHPSNFITTLMKMADVKLRFVPNDNFLGMNIMELHWGDKKLLLKEHQYLNRAGTTGWRRVFVVDMDNAQFSNFGPNGTTRHRELDPHRATGKTTMEGEFQTQFSFVFRLADTHARLRYQTIAA